MASTSNRTQTAPSTTLSSSLSKVPQWKYEVFLSFRGKDTRYSFTDHLYDALVEKGVITFRDDEELEMGRPIKPELLDAIETSRMAVIILSRNYASSSWCLEELAKIVECMKKRGMRVLPVFYYLDPSVVRYQTDTFANAFAKHEERFKENKENIEIVQTWRAALREVAGLSGRHLKKDGYESKVIKRIVENIFHELNDTPSSVYKNGLIGIESRVEEIVDLYIDMASDDVRFIGICGMSGIGKTTLVEEVFKRIRREFQASSLLRNVRTFKLADLQDQLLMDMKLASRRGEWDMGQRIYLTSNRLRKKKVLIILDDVDEEEQLETLAGNLDWYGAGSRIIITTKDYQLLTKNGVQNIYRARKMNASDALQLFSWKAFNKPHYEEEFSDLCNDFVSYAKGLPLALEVLGASLFGKRIDIWKAARDKLKAIPRTKGIQDILKISFDGLDKTEQKLFLHIACFFQGEDQDRVEDILQGSSYHPKIDIETLVDKSLITILERKLWMHNLLQEMGWEIVRQESQEPGGRSRLWLWKDVHHVLKKNTGTTAVEGIMLNTPPHKEEHLNAEAFSKMENLKFIQIHNVQLPRGLSYLSNKLRLMEWHEYPLKSLPRSFQPDKLVELIMPRSHIRQLPKGFSNLGKLKVMDLSDSQNLIKTPDFTRLANLERLIFQGCTRLYEVHPSVGVLKRLTLLNLKDCKCLDSLPRELNLESLEVFILSGCSRLNKFPEIERSMTCLSELYLGGTAIEELPLSIEHLTGLTLLNLQDCNNLSGFPSVICSLTSLQTLILSGCKVQPHKSWHSLGLIALCTYCFFIAQHPEPEPNFLLPPSLSGLSSLVSIDLSDCNLEDEALLDNLSCLSTLQSLNLSKNHFTSLPDSVSRLSKLKFLYLDNCSRLKSLTNIPLSTQSVMARECTSLENYSNQVIVWTSGETGFTFINCLSLGDDEECKLSTVSDQFELVYETLNVRNIHLQPLWQRFMDEQMEKIDQSEGFHGFLRQTRIPKWFTHQNREGSSVPIPLPPDLYENSSWRGIALCTVFEVDKNLNNEDSAVQDSKCSHEFICRLDMDGGVVDSPLVFTFPHKYDRPGSFGLWLYISQARCRERLDVRGCISPSITCNNPNVEIKLCGARLVYEEDMEEFVQNLSQGLFGSPDDVLQRHQEFINYHMDYSNIGESDSKPRLKRELKTLLSILYQGDPARNHWYDYIFPRISIPRWFGDQNFVSDIRMQLPPDLHNNTRWMGFSVYALYSVYKQPAGSGQDSTIILSFSGLSAGEAPSAPYMAFPLSKDIFSGSRRLLVFYIPRVLFGLNQCSELWASFQSNNAGVVKVERCGIRLVYEEDIEESVETLVQCMLECPDEYHESYYRNLFAQVVELQGCDHGKDFSCSFSLQRRPPIPELIENVAEEGCTSPETFSNQGGTSSNSTSLVLAVPLRDEQCGSTSPVAILEYWFKTYMQDYYNGAVFRHCFPQSEIPQWFYHQRDRPTVRMPLPQNLYNNPDWMGFAVCAVFSFHKHPTAINLDSGFPHRFMCHLETNLGCMSPLFEYSISEDEVLISLYQRAFLWVLFIPRGALSHHWSQVTWAEFWFLSDSPDVSALKCGVGLVGRQNMEEFNRTIVQLITSVDVYLKDIRSSCMEGAVCERLTIYDDKRLPICTGKKKRMLPIAQGDPHPHHRFYDTGYRTGPLDFHPYMHYNYCFPPSKVTQEWFSHKNSGYSVTIDIPPNLYNDNNWMGLALCACFSIGGDLETILHTWLSKIGHFLHCQFRTNIASLDNFFGACGTTREEIVWLISLGRFIWISYVPGEPFKDMLRQCSHIEASFVSDWPGVTVQKCGLRLLYQHDQVEFEQKLKHCDALIFKHAESLHQFILDRDKIIEQNSTVYSLSPLEFFERPAQLCKRDLLDFDGCSEYSLCFPPREILYWFSHSSNEPSVTIDVQPTNLYDDSGWMGLFLCAYFSVHEDQTAILENPDSALFSHQLICYLTSNVAGPELQFHVHGTTEEEFRRLYIKDEFIWLSYIPLGSLPDWLNQCTCLEALFFSDWPGLMVQKCGLRFFHAHDMEEFEKIIFRCCLVSENRGFHPSESESSGAKNQPWKKDFDPCLVYNSCFPPNDILNWFSHRSNKPPVTIRLPPNLYDDCTWMGLALCVSFSVKKHCTVDCTLICRLETDIGSLERLHMYHFTKEDLVLLQLGGFIWLSYIPRGSFPNWLNESSFIKASIKTYCRSAGSDFCTSLRLTVKECGFRLLYQNKETEFKETIRHCTSSLSEVWDVIHANAKKVKQNHMDKATEPSTTSNSDGLRLEDKGKRIVEK